MKCGAWKKEHRRSGATVHVRRCGATHAEILLNTSTYNIYRNGKYVTRGSARTVKGAKAAATHAMRRR
jgi:hypothetical protein